MDLAIVSAMLLSGYGSFGHAANGPEVGEMGIV